VNRFKNVTNPRKGPQVIHERQFGFNTIRVIQDNGQMFSFEVSDQSGKILVMRGPYPDLRKAIQASKRYITEAKMER
jgi:hypothetical protein